MTTLERLDVYIRRYLGDSVADRLPTVSFDELLVIREQADLAREYFREDLATIRRASR